MRAFLHDAATVEHDDLVRVHDRTDAVADDERRAAGRHGAQVFEDGRLGVGVDGAERVVEDEHQRLARQRARQRGSLLLPTRQVDAAFPEHRVVPSGEIHDLIVQLGDLGGALSRLSPGAERDVRLDAVGEEEGVLGNDAEPGAESDRVEVREWRAVEEHGATRRVVQARHQGDEGALARPGRPDDRDGLPGLRDEGNIFEDWARSARVGEAHGAELDPATRILERCRPRRGPNRRLRLQDPVQATHRRRAALIEVHDPAERDHRPDEQRQVEAERNELADRDRPGHHLERSESGHQDHGHTRDQHEDRVEGARGHHEPHVPAPVVRVVLVELTFLLRFLRVGAHEADPGQILLHEGRQRGELLLDLFEAPMDDPAEEEDDGREDDHRHHGVHRQPRADVEHEAEREDEARDRVHGVHDGRAGGHPHRQGVVRRAAHQIARTGVAVEGRVEPEQVAEEVVAQVGLDASADAVQQLTHAEAEDAAQEGHDDDHHGVERDLPSRDVRQPHSVDRELHEPGAGDLEDVRQHDAHQAQRESRPVRTEIRQHRLQLTHAAPPPHVTTSIAPSLNSPRPLHPGAGRTTR